MYQVPSLPTESLYKFLAIGSIVLAISSTLLFVNEERNAAIDAIKIETKIDMHNDLATEYTRAVKELKDAYKVDSIGLNKGFVKLIRAQREERTGKVKYTFKLGKKIITSSEFDSYIIQKHKEILENYNTKLIKLNGGYDQSIRPSQYKLNEQQKLKTENEEYLKLINRLWWFLLLLSTVCGYYGFTKWHQMQVLTDKHLMLQIEELESKRASIM